MDEKLGIVLLAVGVLVALVVWARRGSEANRLRRAWFHSVALPRAQAEEVLGRHLAGLRERYPGRAEVWYLRRILSDLRRDRR